jgi:DMATS type aromatic prenyltransferase
MDLTTPSLFQYTGGQLTRLCQVVGLTDAKTPLYLLRQLIGPAAADRPVAEGPLWASDVADDNSPVEFSVEFDENGRPTLRILGEVTATKPGVRANSNAARCLLLSLSDKFGLCLDRFDTVADLFLPDEPHGLFTMWYSLVFAPDAAPRIKVYFNPAVRGAQHAPYLVSTALRRLGLDGAYETVAAHALRRGHRDRLSFFALDLHGGDRARVKVYVSHDDADAGDVELAALAADHVEPSTVREFCSIMGGGVGTFTGLPLVSSYSFVTGDSTRPSGYSVYLPVRGYVPDDDVARARTRELLARNGIDLALLDRAVAAVSRRPLADGVGLIAHVSLRLGRVRPGITVYLSAEAYGTRPPTTTAAHPIAVLDSVQ